MTPFEEIAERERRFLLQTYSRYPIAIARGRGVFLYDLEGKRYLDFVAGLGVNALGHAHPRIVKTIREQAGRVIHLSNLYYNEYQGALLKSCASFRVCSARSSRTAAPRRSKARSSWHDWRATGSAAVLRVNWSGCRVRIMGALSGRCRSRDRTSTARDS